MATGADPTQAAIAELHRRSKRTMAIVIVGMLAVVASLLVFVFRLNDARNDAEDERVRAVKLADQRGKDANATAETLEAVKRALEAGRDAEAKRLLGLAIDQQEIVAQAPKPLPADQAAVTPRRAPAPKPQPKVTEVLRNSEPQRHIDADTPAAITRGKRVYIQFAGPIERSEIVDLNKSLHDAGWDVQGASGERIATALGLNEVRFSSEQDRKAAWTLAMILTKSGVAGRPVTAKQVKVVRPGTLEVWISR